MIRTRENRFNRYLFGGLVAVMSMAVAVPAMAEIEKIVVTARKREEEAQKVPVAITTFTGLSLERGGYTEITDISYETPGLFITEAHAAGSAASINMRGQSQADTLLTTDSSVGVYLDGVNLPRQLGLKSNLFDVERIEVLKGPQGTLYGRNTTGGAINIITKKAHYDGIDGFVEVTGGKYDRFDFGGALNVPIIKDKLAIRLSGKRSKRDPIGVSLANGQGLDDDDEGFIRGSVRIDPSENVSIMIVGDWQRIDELGKQVKLLSPGYFDLASFDFPSSLIEVGIEEGILNPADIPSAANGYTVGPTFISGLVGSYNLLDALTEGSYYETSIDNFSYGKFEAWGLGGTIDVDLGNVAFKSITGYREFKRDNALDWGEPYKILHPRLTTDAHAFSQELQLSGTAFEGKLEWLVGGYYSEEKGTDGSQTLALALLTGGVFNKQDGDVDNSSWALFTQATYNITSKIRLTGGLRYTEEKKRLTSHNRVLSSTGVPIVCNLPPGGVPLDMCEAEFSDTFDGWSWLASLDYSPTDNILIYVRGARGFRGGGQNLRGGTDPTSFSSYRPEFATDIEIGVKTDLFDNRVRLNLSGYRTDYKDIQRSIIVPGDAGGVVTILTNAASATIWGFEAELLVAPTEGLTFGGTFGVVDAGYDEFIDNDPLTGLPRDRSAEGFNIPDVTYSLFARYEQPVFGDDAIVGLQLNWYWQSHVDFDPSSRVMLDVRQESYGLLNLRVDVQITSLEMELAFYVTNLTNEHYIVDTTDLSATALGLVVGVVGQPREWGFTLKKSF